MLDSSSHAIDMQLWAPEGANIGGGGSHLAVETAKLPDESFWQLQLPKSAEFPLEEFLRIGFTQHIAVLTKAKSLPKRLFYIRRSAEQDYSVEELEAAIARDDYRHQGSMPNNFTKTIPATSRSLRAITAFKDEYLLDFKVFTFVRNQYHLDAFGEDQYIDLLFFNRELNCLVAVELKTGKFKTSYLGQLQGYLSVLDGFERKPHENPSIGIILCKDMNKSFVDYVIQDYTKPMGVATYKTADDMPEKLRKALPDVESLRKLLDSESDGAKV